MVACAVAIVLALVALLHLAYNYARLKSIPGPFLASFSDVWRALAQRSPVYGRHLAEIHTRYGDVVRLGPNVVGIRDHADIARFCRVQLLKELANISRVELSDFNDVSHFEGLIDRSTGDFVRTIQRHKVLDATTYLRFFAEDFVSRFIFTDLTSSSLNTNPISGTKYPRDHQPCPPSTFLSCLEDFLLKGPVSLLKRERLSCSSLKLNPTQAIYRKEIILPQTQTTTRSPIVAAGIDSIISTFASAFSFLLLHPTVLSLLRNEIDTAFRLRSKAIVPLWSEIIRLPYLDAVMKESMRHLSIRNVPAEIRVGTTTTTTTTTATSNTASLRIPPGAVVTWHPYTVLFNGAVYGDDADAFRPERWLTATLDQRELMEQCLLPFSVCVASCPEFEAAWLELKKTVVILLREFDIRLVFLEEPSSRLVSSDCLPSMLVRFAPRIY